MIEQKIESKLLKLRNDIQADITKTDDAVKEMKETIVPGIQKKLDKYVRGFLKQINDEVHERK